MFTYEGILSYGKNQLLSYFAYFKLRYQTSSGVLLISSGPFSSATARLPLGRIILEAQVSDSLGASTVQQFQVQVIINLT